ncbi:hypothetical protein KCU93_g406, partial [Aureobasidium melanogenum]
MDHVWTWVSSLYNKPINQILATGRKRSSVWGGRSEYLSVLVSMLGETGQRTCVKGRKRKGEQRRED